MVLAIADGPSSEPLSPHATQTVTPTADADCNALLYACSDCAVHDDSGPPQRDGNDRRFVDCIHCRLIDSVEEAREFHADAPELAEALLPCREYPNLIFPRLSSASNPTHYLGAWILALASIVRPTSPSPLIRVGRERTTS